MATGNNHVILNDLEADALPVYFARMEAFDGECTLSPTNNVKAEGKTSEVPNSKFWKKRPDVSHDFLKSLWNPSSDYLPESLESQVSVDGENKCFPEPPSEDEDECFQNDLSHGSFTRWNHSGNVKSGIGNVKENDKISPELERVPPVKPERTGIRNIESRQNNIPKDTSVKLADSTDESIGSLSEQNYEEELLHSVCVIGDPDDVLQTNLLYYSDQHMDDSVPQCSNSNFNARQREPFDHHVVKNQNSPNFEDHFHESPIYEGSKFSRGNQAGGSQTHTPGTFRSFEGEANIPRQMYPEGSHYRGHLPRRGGNPETNPFMNTFSEEISYGNSVGIENYSSELPIRRSNSSEEHSDVGRKRSPMPPPETTRPKPRRSAVIMTSRGCGNCQNCRATKLIDHMESLAESAGFDIHDVLPDGNCMFRAIVDQLRMRGDLTMTAGKLRQSVVQFLREHPCSEDGTHMQMFLPTEKWEDYLSRMEKDGEWGDEMALRGIAEVIKRQIKIISAIGTDQHNQITIQPTGVESDQQQDVFLGHMDDYHYISLRPKNWEDTWFVRAREKTCSTKPKTDKYADNSIRVSGMDAPVNTLGCVADYFDDDTSIDSMSDTPIGHLSYVMKNVMSSKTLMVHDPQVWDDQIENMNSQTRATRFGTLTAVGSVAEKFAVYVYDRSPIQIGYSLRKDPVTNAPSSEVSPQILISSSSHQIVEHDEDESISPNLHKAVMETYGIHPGYIRLRKQITNTTPRNSQGKLMASFLPNSFLDPLNGPIDLQLPHSLEQNVKYAIHGNFWPECASEWKTRERPSGWPKPEFIKNIIEDGFLVVPVAHPMSECPDLEFQITFAKAEKLLARRNMTKHQRYCFQIFKVLVDFHTRQTALLTTEYLKMVFFYASEVVPRNQWRLNPGAALLYLVDQLLHYLRSKDLPHYFIRSNNMIDHFSDDALQNIVTHMEAVRQFPVMSIVILAEGHGLTSSWMADPIIEDIPTFTKHHDLQKSFVEVFIPTTLKNAINYVRYMMLQPAADVIMDGYQDMKSICESKAEYEWCFGSIFDFIHQVLCELHFFQQFWLCVVLDILHETSTVKALTRRLPGKTIKEILGNEEKGELDNIVVPLCVMNTSCAKHSSEFEADPELGFLKDLSMHLTNMRYYNLAAHYLRASVSLTKRKLAELSNLRSLPDGEGMGNIGKKIPKLNSVDFTRQQALKMYLNNFLVSLFNAYHYDGQTELFQEYVADLQEVVDTISEPSAYRNLAKIWGYLGCDDRAQKATDRMEELIQLCSV